MKQIEEQYTGPRVLPQVRIGEKVFTIDLRLREFRDSQEPWLNVGFDSRDGRILCQQTGISGAAGAGHTLSCRVILMALNCFAATAASFCKSQARFVAASAAKEPCSALPSGIFTAQSRK